VTTQLTSLLAYAEYLALTTCSAVALAYAFSSECIFPQHFMYPFPEPHGHGSTAAPPKPEDEEVVPFVFFGVVAGFLASRNVVAV
jgi:hypothetical protein